jgi:hypothetical protein
MRIGRGNRSTRRKSAPVPLCSPHIANDLGSNVDYRVGNTAINTSAMERSHSLRDACFFKRTVTCRTISRQHPKYAHAIEKILQVVFSMWSAPCSLLGNRSLNTFPQKQTRGTKRYLLLGNGAVNRLCQQYRLCFPWGQCKVVIR